MDLTAIFERVLVSYCGRTWLAVEWRGQRVEAEDIRGTIHWGISKATIWMTYRAGFITGTMMLINHRTVLTIISKIAIFSYTSEATRVNCFKVSHDIKYAQ